MGARRKVTLSRRLNNPVRADSEQPLPQAGWRAPPGMPFRLGTASSVPPLFKDTGVNTAATAAEAGPTTGQVQRWHSSNGAKDSVPVNSGMQLWAAQGCADMNQSADNEAVNSVQLGQGGGDKQCRKRLAEATAVQPSSKRWRLQAHPDSVGISGQHSSLWETANVAGSGSRKAGREGPEGGWALSSAGLDVSSPAATRFHWFLEKMDQLAS